MNNAPSKNEITLLKVFNYLGGTLIFLGISYFIADNWGALNNFTKIFVTLGAAIAAFIIGILFNITKKNAASSAFFLISALLLPMGLAVTLSVAKVNWSSEISNLFIATICFGVFLIAVLYSVSTLFILFTIIFASFFYVFLIDVIAHYSNFTYTYLSNYEIIALGLSYIFLGYYLDKSSHRGLTGPLYLFGGFFVLFESFSLGSSFIGYSILQWEIVTPILILLAFIFSVPLRSKSFLYLGAIFLLCYIGDISSKFIKIFGDMGWSLILILLGFLLISVGYLVIFIHKKINRIKFD